MFCQYLNLFRFMFQQIAKTRRAMLGDNYFWWSQQSNTIVLINTTEKQESRNKTATQSWLLLSDSLEPNMHRQKIQAEYLFHNCKAQWVFYIEHVLHHCKKILVKLWEYWNKNSPCKIFCKSWNKVKAHSQSILLKGCFGVLRN